ncbi:NarK/NasA family nitrate transporter [Mesorhizobium sp. M2D.F.Ca.ET.185.01.1.1]|uniref:MFS transporter n=1 Tax=unclassified Mesorhizobium TaxID=325217 RepID=UPI000FCC3861|nr:MULTISPECIES: nitrate/nitrite transporter [unclassified Mesorhizobium]TGP83008.1 NarK/NasA family nitrate transporter [bacterium M00.F.Ca.ET.227.01.1.1]TGP98965.1 NarK/NasA family nitrate transporter [bacterium M00.F.Ca.ET.221.01.1.1]TGP99695.1 NarK/NasA family nitrate transporter [bacterium M00.F.Ca.ET.222.01.1.1]TGT96976.1 NarK/NasA family nitrate transporter [bacterium M00.F.Ca.ET.163.01.1.1]TGU25250.1 NarK/NasA family nitrate transporter [bacterium M00.F.Ca.ET.156.01.1.1]TGU42565.1 Nar
MTANLPAAPSQDSSSRQALVMSTIAFTVCFAVWTIFSIIGVRIKQELGLSETEFGLLVGTPILTGSLVRMVLGVWTDRFGGRLVYTLTMLAAAVATFLLAFAHSYGQMLVAALGVGLAGGSFAVGVAYVSRFFPAGKQGTALGIFGVGNVGAAVTKFLAPLVLLAWGWQSVALIWTAALVVMAIVFWFTTNDDPVIRERRAGKAAPARSFWQEFAPLKNLQVWRFAFYYFFAFGAFVALSLWLPRYLIGVYGFGIATAGMIGAAYSIPASIFRAYGGVLSDRVGARTVLYWTFSVSAVATLVLSLPSADYVVRGISGPIQFHFEIGPLAFIAVACVLGFFMSLGKAAVYKHIPAYYPQSVGAVGGVVGMIGGLGGFILPIAFGALNDLTGVRSSCFMLLFLLVVSCLVWMHFSIRRMERAAALKTSSLSYAAE